MAAALRPAACGNPLSAEASCRVTLSLGELGGSVRRDGWERVPSDCSLGAQKTFQYGVTETAAVRARLQGPSILSGEVVVKNKGT